MKRPNPDNAAHISVFVIMVFCILAVILADHFHKQSEERQQIIQEQEQLIQQQDSTILYYIYTYEND